MSPKFLFFRKWIVATELQFMRMLYIHRHVSGVFSSPCPNFFLMFCQQWKAQWKSPASGTICLIDKKTPYLDRWWLSLLADLQSDEWTCWTSKTWFSLQCLHSRTEWKIPTKPLSHWGRVCVHWKQGVFAERHVSTISLDNLLEELDLLLQGQCGNEYSS